MKKMIAMILCCLMLTACGTAPAETVATAPTLAQTTLPALAETTAPISEIQQTIPLVHFVTLYAPNEDATGFIYASCELEEITADTLCTALIGADVLKEDVKFNSITAENGHIQLDVNFAFAAQLMSYGTAGEYMMMGSVVNTLLSAYGAETLSITMDGQMLESGHVIYDFPLEFHE